MATHTLTTVRYIFKTVRAHWKQSRETICALNSCDNFRHFANVSHENALADEICDDNIPLIPANPKTVKVAVIGVPNAGKSTVINNLTGRKICPISSKVHTTRFKVRAVAVEGNTQIVFVDTPGLVSAEETKKYKLEKPFIRDGEKAMAEADVIGVVHDASNRWTRDSLDAKVLRLLHIFSNKESVLIVNKVDVVKSKRKLLDTVRLVTRGKLTGRRGASSLEKHNLTENELQSAIEGQRGWPNFKEVFLVSALDGSGMEAIKAYLLGRAQPGPWVLPVDRVTDQRPEQVVETTVRAKLLDHLPQELPYVIRTSLTYMETNELGHLVAVVVVECPTPRLQKIVLGKNGDKIRAVARAAELDLFSAFKQPVFLKLVVDTVDKP